jgi:4-amino-4-deoxy-L-arabinose transferase-like glycosyltransferase
MSYVPPVQRKRKPSGFADILPRVLLGLAAVFYLLCFVHLRADFPHGTPWNDSSKITDEGWYAGGAIHHYVFGHWFLADSFNAAVALPVWPVLLGVWFKMTGVGMVAARTLTLLVYAASLVLFYALLNQYRRGLLPAVAVALMAINPFCYAFNRLAILEPLVVFWLMLGLWIASKTRDEDLWKQGALGAILCVLVLTKTSAFFLGPAILYQLMSTIGWPSRRTILAIRTRQDLRPLRAAGIVAGSAAALWLLYFLIAVVPRHYADYRLLFTIGPGHLPLSTLPDATIGAIAAGLWMSRALWLSALFLMLVSFFWLRELWRMPIFGSCVVAIVGYLAVILDHANRQASDYLVIAMPVVAIVLLGIDALWQRKVDGVAAFIAVVLIFTSMAMMFKTVRWVLKPETTLSDAAQALTRVVRTDQTAKPLLLSTSGDDITLMTGLPALTDVYTTHGLPALLDRYQPGWAAVWDGQDTTGLSHRYRLNERARYKVFDDPARNTLILYRLDQP